MLARKEALILCTGVQCRAAILVYDLAVLGEVEYPGLPPVYWAPLCTWKIESTAGQRNCKRHNLWIAKFSTSLFLNTHGSVTVTAF